MFHVVGGKKKSSYTKNKRGGSNNLSPADFSSLDNTLPNGANFEKMNDKFSSNLVGGAGYGFGAANIKDVATFGGNYAPTSSYNEEGSFANRGGNNFGKMDGGKHKHSSKCKHKRTMKRGGKRFRQKGCSRKSK